MSGLHTPEPWCVGDRSTIVYCNDGFAVANATVFHGRHEPDTSEANARRIVACVNACAGCATEILEVAPVGFFNSTYGHPRYLAELEKQRDELLAALEHFATWARGQHRAQRKGCHATFDMMMLLSEIDFAEAAIANAKGATP